MNINSPISFDTLRIVPSIITLSGIILGASPPENLPIVRTAGSAGAISLLIISCSDRYTWAAILIGSTPVSGIAPWHPTPFTVILNLMQPAILGPVEYKTMLDGLPEWTCIAIAASTLGFSRTPASSIFFAPVNPSSSGWKTNLIVPSIWSSYCLSSLAAPRSMAVWRSWPHACMLPLYDLNSQLLSSLTGRESISALKRNVLPVFSPFIVATIPLSHISFGSYPNSLSFPITNLFF